MCYAGGSYRLDFSRLGLTRRAAFKIRIALRADKRNGQMGEIQDIQKALEKFAIEKNWEKYHTIRNLVLALGSEVGELQAEFRWMSDEETNNLDEEKKRSIEDEIADVAIFLFRLTDVLKIDIYQAVQEKLEKNSKRVIRGPEFTS